MSSPTSQTIVGDEGPEPRDYTGAEWDAASLSGKLQLMLGANPKGRPPRWGWVVYRTAYQPELDGAWAALEDHIRNRMRNWLCAPNEDADIDIVNKTDWVFVQDAAALDGITRDALRHQFQAWAVAEAPDLTTTNWARGVRYEYFLQADEDALASVLQPPTVPGASYVNLVQAWPEKLPADVAFDEDGKPYPPEDWMKMTLQALHPSNYIELDHPEAWYVYYRDPDEGAWMY
ncbi:hypothetical protein JX265_003141 [Neoarthrinium moseri]|uniref:Uncharacterized protein n=1 Tax=Neoarthrinium moseri TaxID=1658444 RepID=A0A9P9WTV8_9PEZI|nr:uncharacterized protein JN550_011248 [Neoarthrinium moseri]KAI1852651.1 hypothetical protein JX266_002192 [Neoarthrinium moseri]KAI1860786.1 hypothetical protein JN550_011248 [Neoarthrinium moseri]KAI1878964.1 hypothetical protein JX265_003141 [Neoarthrinium moseri]